MNTMNSSSTMKPLSSYRRTSRGPASRKNYLQDAQGKQKLSWRIWTLCLVVVAFYAGFLTGTTMSTNNSHASSLRSYDTTTNTSQQQQEQIDKEVARQVKEALESQRRRQQQSAAAASSSSSATDHLNKENRRFPYETANFLVGAATVDRHDFVTTFDTGTPPPLQPSPKNSHVYLLYQTERSMPAAYKEALKQGGTPPVLDVATATQECGTLNIITMKPFSNADQCIAIVGQYESNHILRYMRINEKGGPPMNKQLPLTRVGRGLKSSGQNEFRIPNTKAQQHNWQQLVDYFSEGLPQAMEELKPILQHMTGGVKPWFKIEEKERPSIIAMVSNLGQADLLTNFVCTAGDMDLSKILVFCTDEETLQLAKGLGLNAYYNSVLFGNVDRRAAQAFGDNTFVSVMWAKVVAIHVLQQLGFHVLFQDADVVWNSEDYGARGKNIHPLDVFEKPQGRPNNIPDGIFTDHNHEYDILFVDDGARNVMFAPYAGNSGFYYVRYNDRTKWLFTSFVYISGDLLYITKSHQQILSNLMSEHALLYGLKVKTMYHHPLLMGGYEYNSRKELMKKIYIHQTIDPPLLFHMCWTQSHVNKKAFMKQMGFWQVKTNCLEPSEILTNNNNNDSHNDFKQACCAAEPIRECFYSDKPSVIPCSDSPKLDQGQPDFWKGVVK